MKETFRYNEYIIMKNSFSMRKDRISEEGDEEVEAKKKHKTGTFVVHVKCCENATWQGEVTWAEENCKEQFRSALELIRLIDGALDTGSSE